MQKYKNNPKYAIWACFFISYAPQYLFFRIKKTTFALMIGLERHIEILLLTNDCVIVPGLGGFVANHREARFDNNDNMFIPPYRTLGFNPKLSVNDSLLAQSYTETYDISYPEACNRIENEVNELKQHIYNNGSYELNDVGVLCLNNDGNIEFTPCEAGIVTPDLYSLSSFEMRKLKEMVQPENCESDKTEILHFPPINNNAQRHENSHGDIGNNGITNKNEKKKEARISASAIRNFIAAAAAVVLFFLLGTPVNENSSTIKTSALDNGIVQELINNGYNVVRNDKKKIVEPQKELSTKNEVKKQAKENTDIKLAVAKPQNSDVKSQYFCIVLASRVSQKNANAFTQQLQKQGFNASVLQEKGKSIKVVYGNYATKNDAYNALNDLQGNEHFYGAWIYKVN